MDDRSASPLPHPPAVEVGGEEEDMVNNREESIRRPRRAKESTPIRREGSLTMVQKDDDGEEEEDKAVGAEAGNRMPSERTRKLRFPRRPPKIDAQLAQVQVSSGPFDRNLRPPSPVNPEVRVVWTGEMTEEILAYLAFCRKLIGKGEVPVTEPLEEDEQALEFLQEHGGSDVDRAKLMLLASAGGGSEVANITLSQINDTKARPRAKGVFRSWVGESEQGQDAGNPAKVKQAWKEWTSRCKKALASNQTTAVELASLQKQERQIPRFQSRGSQEEDSLVSAANEVSFDLDTRLKDIELYVAEIHDALSLVHPERRFTAHELKRLADEAPKKVQMKEVDILKDLVSKSESWEKRAARWLQDDDDSTNGTASNASISSSTGTVGSGAVGAARRRGGTATSSLTSVAQTSRDQEFTLALLNELIREGNQSSIDHSVTLKAIMTKRSDCEALMKRLALHVPQDKSWKQNRKKYDILTLPKLKELRDEMRKIKLKLPQAAVLDSHIAQAEEWVEAAKRTSNEKCTIKELQALLTKADQIPVNLSEEKKVLEQFLIRASDWIRRAKGFFPPTNSSAVVVAPTKKTRANLAALEAAGVLADGGFQKGTSEDFLALRDEAIDIGLDTLTEAASALEVAESVDDWIARVNEAMKDVTDDKLDLLHSLLLEAENLPVIVGEERELRNITMKRTWSRDAANYLKATPGSVPLADLEGQLVEADRLFPNESKKKKTKRTTLLENEAEMRVVVEEARSWIDRANQILQATLYSEKLESYEQVRDILIQRTQANVSQLRRALVKRIREIADWQRYVRRALLDTGVVDPQEFDAKVTLDVILADVPEFSVNGNDQSDDEAVDDGHDVDASDRMDVEVADESRNGDDAKESLEHNEGLMTTRKLPLKTLKDMLDRAQRVGVVTPELATLIKLDEQVRAWQARFAVVLLDPAASSALLLSASNPSSASKSKKKRKSEHGDSALPTAARLALKESDLMEMVKDADTLPVDVSAHLADLQACLEASIEWRKLCTGPLERYRKASRELQHSGNWVQMASGGHVTSASCFQAIVASEGKNIHEDELLEKLHLIVRDVHGNERSPAEKEQECAWWKDEYPDSIRAAMSEVVEAMREAERRKLHLIGLDSMPVRLCAWLIQADSWLEELKTEFLEVADAEPKSLWSVCQATLNGLRILVSVGKDEADDPLPEQFPESVLEEYSPPANLASQSQFQAPATAAIAPPPKRLRKATAEPSTFTSAMPEEEKAATTVSVEEPQQQQPSMRAASPTESDEWRILKYTKVSSAAEAEDMEWRSMSLSVPNVSGTILRRLLGLEKTLQSAFAARGLARRMNRVPRNERSQARLKQYIALSACWTRSFSIVEDPRFKHELSLSEAWVDEKKKTLVGRKSTVEQLEKLASKGEKVWVDVAQIEYVRNQARLAREWFAAFKATGVEEGATAITTTVGTGALDELKDLLKRGEKIQGVDVTAELELLKKATQIFCICAGPKDKNMMHCSDCLDLFHPECTGGYYQTLCPICNVVRAIQRCVGQASAAVCRVQVLEAYLNDPSFAYMAQTRQVVVQDLDQARMVVEWMRQVRPLLEPDRLETAESEMLAREFPRPPEALHACAELRVVLDAITARRWRPRLETLRRRPSLEQLETVLHDTPSVLRGEPLRGLEHLCERGRRAFNRFDEIWNAPLSTPQDDIVERCGELSHMLDHLPLEGVAAKARAVDACIEDNANRHCLCNKFDNGTKMVSCSKCSRWFHEKCLKQTGNPKYLQQNLDSDDDFFCPDCLAESQQPL